MTTGLVHGKFSSQLWGSLCVRNAIASYDVASVSTTTSQCSGYDGGWRHDGTAPAYFKFSNATAATKSNEAATTAASENESADDASGNGSSRNELYECDEHECYEYASSNEYDGKRRNDAAGYARSSL